MSQTLSQKTALVTGASRGLGRATALRLASAGANVIVHYSASREAAESVVAAITSQGGQARAIAADLSTLDGVASLTNAIDQLDILINNAGVLEGGGLAATTPDQFDRMFNVNVRSLFFLTQALAPKIQDGGRIINLSSVVSRVDFPGIAGYAATKGAVDVLTRAFANELGPRGITVNAVAPGATDTEMAKGFLGSEEGRQFIQSIQSLKRIGQPDDVAAAIAALVSEDGRWITGQIIEVSGGTRL